MFRKKENFVYKYDQEKVLFFSCNKADTHNPLRRYECLLGWEDFIVCEARVSLSLSLY